MTDQTTAPAEQSPATFDKATVDAMIAKAVEEATTGLKAKNTELLSETKAEREKRTALEAAQAADEAERQKKAGEYQALYDSEAAKRKETEHQLAELRGTIAKRDVDAAAASIGSALTRDTAKAAILQEQASKFAKHGDSGVTYEIGGVAVDRAKVIEHLTAQYPFLVDGNQSNGGGASGGGGGAATKKLAEMSEAERRDLAEKDPNAFRQMVADAKKR